MGLEDRGVVDQGVNFRRLQHVGVILKGTKRMQRRADTAGELHGGDIRQDFRPVGGDNGDPTAHPQSPGLQGLHHLAGSLPHLPIGGDLVPQQQAGFVVVAVQALHQQVGHQGGLVQFVYTHGRSRAYACG